VSLTLCPCSILPLDLAPDLWRVGTAEEAVRLLALSSVLGGLFVVWGLGIELV
jgi:hypothetical protein